MPSARRRNGGVGCGETGAGGGARDRAARVDYMAEPRPIFLVIDDDASVRSADRRVLSRYADVRRAGSAEEGLWLIRGEPFTLALIDLCSPSRPRRAWRTGSPRASWRASRTIRSRAASLWAASSRVRYPDAAVLLQTAANEHALPGGG